MPHTAATHPAPLGVAQWRERVAGGADPLPLLQACREAALASQALAVWISLPTPAQWQQQLDLLSLRLAEPGSRAELVQRYPLLGVPFAAKDNIHIAGVPTTAGCPAFSHVPERSATVVQRLLDAGAIWLGKTNLDQFATGLVGTRSPYGRPSCAFDAQRISGGSSSGSAVALARGQVAFALGTDTAGSGRVPAAFNGLVGLKPTPGRISTAGVVPACRSIDCVSLFAHTVDDAAHLLAMAEGADALDAYSAFQAGPARAPAAQRIGVPRAPAFFGNAGYAPMFAAAIERARSLGQAVVEVDFTRLFEVAALLYEGPWVAERHSTVRSLLSRQPEAFDPTVRKVIERAVGLTATDAFEAQYRLRALQCELQMLWQQVDLLMVPTAPGHPTFAEVDADPVGVNAMLGTYTNFVNLLGWCALALPAGTSAAGLPFGVSFIAPATHDAALLHWARRWHAQPAASLPQRQPASTPVLPIAVVGAHLSGLPLNRQLLERGAVLRESARTAPCYRLFALPDTRPPKPGLQRCAEGGAAIELEVWDMPMQQLGSFLALIPAPLGLGSIELADGSQVHGFLCEGHALQAARDISHFGGWRAYLASL
ncbi:MAG TPA: allophanate hydrolase [Rubrivivax sp.]|nr:allophanate hydrolase [Rubrivivax sp.]